MLNQSTTDLVFQALGDPTRRAIVERLSRRGVVSVSELARPLELTLAAVVQHLQVLEASGLVTTQKLGRVRSCSLRPAGLSLATRWLESRRSAWERHFDRLGEYLAEDPSPAEKDET